MDTPLPTDPFAFWREIYNQAEQAWTDAVQKTISTPAYAESMGKSSQAMLNNFEVWRNFSERYLNEVWNLPTRNDLGRLGEVIVAIDAKADDLDERADRIDATLARLEERLSELDRRLAGLAENGPAAVQRANQQVAERVAGLEGRLAELIGRADRVAGLEGRLDELLGRSDRLLAAIAGNRGTAGSTEPAARRGRGNRTSAEE